MRPRIPKVVAGGLAAAVLTAALGGAAFAQVSNTTPTPARTPPAAVQQRATDFLNGFSSKLGKAPADVLAAFKAARKDQVAADVTAGRITPAQADRINARIDAETMLPFGGPGFGPGPGGPARGHDGGPFAGPVDPRALATFLGAQPADLRTALQTKSLAAFAQEKGKSRDDLKAFLTNQEKTKLTAAVTAGKLTQAQADTRLAGFSSQLDTMIDRVGAPGRGPGAGGPRGPRGGGPGAPGAQGGQRPGR